MPKSKRTVHDWLLANREDLTRVGSLLILFGGIVTLLAISPGFKLGRDVENLEVGDSSPNEIVADFNFEVEDQGSTEAARRAARENAPHVFVKGG